MKNSKNTLGTVSTKRNKWLEPLRVGTRGPIGYNKEIHEDDAIEFTYKLPLGATKRLIKSYYEDIQRIDSDYIYYASTGSYEIRMRPYYYRMIFDLRKQLDKHGLNWKKIDGEVFDRYFKKDYQEMERYDKNHSGQDPFNDIKSCKDPECCNQTRSLVYKLKIISRSLRMLFSVFRGRIPADRLPH